MAEIASFGVNVDQNTRLAQNAQDTANKADTGIGDLNDPNLMSVIEKQTQASQYAGLTSQYNVILARAEDDNISTTALTAAYNNLDTFMTVILTDTTKASDVNRGTYKSLTDAYNTALSNVQNALKDAYNNDIDNMQSSVSIASQAASSAVIVASQATVTGNSASQVASQVAVVASQAQIAGDNATSVANNASQAASGAVIAGSTAAVKADKASSDYQTLSSGVKDGSVVHITTETVIDKEVIGTAEIADGAITTAQIGSEAVGSAKIADLAVGTAQIGNGAITNAKIGKLAVGTAQIANAAITDAQIGNVSANKLIAGTIDFNTITGKNINASNITTGTLDTDRLNVGKLSALSADLGDVTAGSLKGVDVVANTFSTPNGSFTTDKNGAITAKNMTLTGGTLSSPTINAGIISGSTINGTTFNAGNRIDNSNNTSNLYPLTINPDGGLTSTHIENGAGLQTYISGGTVNTRYNRFATNGYGQYTSNSISMGGDGSIAVTSNGTTNKDTAFNAPIASTYGAVYITPGGISLHGVNESLWFHGTSKIGTNGIKMDNYGNVHGGGTSAWWRVYDSSGSKVANFGTAPGNNITFPKPLFVDEIGGYSSNNGHALFIHGDDAGKSGSTGQMAFKRDSRSALVTSASIYNRTYSSGSNVYITSYGTLGRSTSASKYKYNIKHAIDEDSLADKLLTMHVSTWNDKHAVDSYAQTLTDNTESEDISIKDNYGLIAEDLRDAGLDMFVEYGKNHTIEGIEYDRAWLPLLPKMRQMNDKINEYELRISKLEAKINE